MKSIVKISRLPWPLALCYAGASFSQAPADAPAGTNGVCKDGTYSQAAHKQGACRGHQGVKEWYAALSSRSSAARQLDMRPGARQTCGPALPGSAGPGGKVPPASWPPNGSCTWLPRRPPAAPATRSAGYTPPATPAAGGGPGMVWVNTSSNVYHCPSDRWYGKTKHGAYMSEGADAAKAKGARPDHGKTCHRVRKCITSPNAKG